MRTIDKTIQNELKKNETSTFFHAQAVGLMPLLKTHNEAESKAVLNTLLATCLDSFSRHYEPSMKVHDMRTGFLTSFFNALTELQARPDIALEAIIQKARIGRSEIAKGNIPLLQAILSEHRMVEKSEEFLPPPTADGA